MPQWAWMCMIIIWIGVVIGIGLALRQKREKRERRAEELWQEAFQDELEYRKKLGALKKRLDRRKGRIEDVKTFPGEAKWTENFTPPTQPYDPKREEEKRGVEKL